MSRMGNYVMHLQELENEREDAAQIYDRTAQWHWDCAKSETHFLTRHCQELQAKRFEWEAAELRKNNG